MASSLLALGDLIEFQLERLNLDELTFKDELQLQRHLFALDQPQSPGSQELLQAQQQLQQLPHSHSRSYSLGHTPQQKQRPDKRRHPLQHSKSCGTNSQHQLPALSTPRESRLHMPTDSDEAQMADVPGSGRASVGGSMAGGLGKLGSIGEMVNDEEMGAVGGAPLATCSSAGGSAIDLQREFRTQVLEWFQQLYSQTESFKSDERSGNMREAGNNSYRKEHHPLKACDLYTEAIFLAPVDDEGNTITAAIAHANRSTVLHDYGMFEQSYDDCLCALELGYPEEYHVLIKLRQAACALKLRNFTLCELHVHELLHMNLSEAFEKRTHELWHECEILKSEKIEMGVQTDEIQLLSNVSPKVYEIAWPDNANIITTNKGAYVRAVCDIAAYTPVLHEQAAVFVPSGQARICDNCAATQFVPFPCLQCSNRSAVYCSRKCRNQHASIHVLECFAHQIELFEEFAACFTKARLLQLAFRMLITGLPQVVPHCRKRPTVNKMWNAFNGILTERPDIPYSTLLRLETHLDRDDLDTTVSFAVAAHILVIYLAECTDFFDHLDRLMPAPTKLTRSEWMLLSAALLLRHIGQLRHKNLTHCPSFVLPADPRVLDPADEYTLWSSIKHVHKGQLHLLAGDVANVAYAVYPQTLSVCRHSCAGVLYRKFSGRQLTAYATCNLAAGACLANCFATSNYRQSLRETRRLELKRRGIDCKCDHCCRLQPDEDFHKFHRYRCDNPNCMQIFTPPDGQLKCTRNLRWWRSAFYASAENSGADILACSVCEDTQKLEWFWTFSAALADCDSIEGRCKLYAAIERADTQLVEMNECKVALARQLVEQCLLIHREGSKPLDDWEFNKLGSIMRNALNIVAVQYSVFSLEYVQHMSYFWDVMALSNYKCSDKELMQMLQALEFIPDEFKEIFINYYDGFITSKFAEETYTSLMDTQV